LTLGYNKIKPTIPTTKEELVDLVIDAFNSAAERDIYTGMMRTNKYLK